MNKRKLYIGIDPGRYGAVCLIDNTDKNKKNICSLFEYDDVKFYNLLKKYDNEYIDIWLEQVWYRPGAGGKATFNFGVNYGRIIGILNACNRNINFVPPATWKKIIGVTEDKQTSIDMAERLFPGVNLYKTPQCKNKHDGLAESLLIAEFGIRYRESEKKL